MWSSRAQRTGSDTTNPTTLTLRELMATQPRHVRGRLLPGERYPTGMRPGRRRAQGMDLDSVGPYVPGDDIRWMDWRATARTGRAQMKRFVAESHLARMLIVDFRAHLLFGTETRPMAKTAALLAAHMAWEGFVLQEPVGMVIVPDQVLVRPRRGRSHVLFLLKHLEESYAAALSRSEHHGEDALVVAIDTASRLLKFGDEICVFSDFGDTAPALAEKVRELNAFRHFRAIIVEDPMFRRPLRSGRYPYQTTGDPVRRLATVSKSMANRHQDVVRELRRNLRRALIKDGWRITEAASGGFLSPGPGR
ncbi:MAG: DUF58 domain-containing protein [Rhodospirillales bacterium]|nr:DUF58 domain-containing protein [Rhodospirillales bacterium]